MVNIGQVSGFRANLKPLQIKNPKIILQLIKIEASALKAQVLQGKAGQGKIILRKLNQLKAKFEMARQAEGAEKGDIQEAQAEIIDLTQLLIKFAEELGLDSNDIAFLAGILKDYGVELGGSREGHSNKNIDLSFLLDFKSSAEIVGKVIEEEHAFLKELAKKAEQKALENKREEKRLKEMRQEGERVEKETKIASLLQKLQADPSGDNMNKLSAACSEKGISIYEAL